jgi:hypothetical protein
VLQAFDQLSGGEMRTHLVLGSWRQLLHGSSNVRHSVDERERIV